MLGGWVSMDRAVLDHWVSSEPELFAFWVRLIMEANFEDKKKMFNGTLVEIKRGQVIFGLDAFSARTNISHKKLRRYLDLLEKEGMIGRQKTNKFSLISITNYDQHQQQGRQEAGKGQAEGKQAAGKGQHRNNVNKGKNENKDNTPASSPDHVCGFDFKKWPEVPDKTIVADWLKVRTTKKAKLTQTAVDRMAAEMHRAAEQDISVNECIGYAVEKSWAGFKLAWMTDKPNGRAASGPSQGIDFERME